MSKRNSHFVAAIVGISLLYASLANGQDIFQPRPDRTQTTAQGTIDNILKEFYDKHSLPGGVSLAISYRGRLVYAGTIGYADRERKIPLTTEHRMRIASLSKPITAIAIMKLVEERKLNLNDEVFGETGIFKGEYGVPKFENRPVKITVKQLLEHTGGGWGNARNDPMYHASNAIGEEYMRTIIRDRPLEHLPGTKHDYSNFGYWVLGRVIEKASGVPYEDYVKEHILKPCGISGMRIGGDASAPDEAEYIGNRNENPYSSIRSPRRMDAVGGWIATPTELLKLLVRVDGFSTVPDILRSETIRTMTTPSAQSPNYALGWFVNQNNGWFHTGAQLGATSLMERVPNGFNWVILINSSASPDEFIRDRDGLMGKILGTVRTWSTGTEL